MKTVWVKVELLEGRRDPDGAAGLWEVTLDEDVPKEGHAVGAALDVFHESIGISDLEDFEVSTLNPKDQKFIAQADDYEEGFGPDGVAERIGDTDMDFGPSR